MADLTFIDSHNMVAYLEKSKDNADFAIVDFLNASPISSKSTDWNEFGTNIASAVICLAKKQKFNFSKLIFDAVFNDEYDTPSHTKKVFANIRTQGKDFSGTVTPLFTTMLIQSQAVEGKGSGQPSEPQHTPTTASPSHIAPIPTVASSSSHPKKTQKQRKTKRKATEISQSSGPTTLVADEIVHEEKGDNVERAATTATGLDSEHDSDCLSFGNYSSKEKIQEVRKEEKFKNSTTQEEIIQEDSEIQGRYGHDIGVNTAITSITTAIINITTVEPITTASAPVTTAGVSIKSEKLKAKGVTMQEPSESGTRVRILQAELDEEARLEREREKEASKAVNIAEWDAIQAMMDADY
ncbi:hypothetical protein Tco_1352088 [Tanacetum coccineum]